MHKSDESSRPDLTKGVPAASLSDGKPLVGHVGDDQVMLVRTGGDIFAVRALCTHYRGPLGDGLVVGDTVRCPLHHACFSLRTGEALRAPALDPLSCWRVDREGDQLFVREKLTPGAAPHPPRAPESVVIIGGGGAGLAAAEMLRRDGYKGPVTIFSADSAPPPDRPNLSKDYLAGEAEPDWIPLEPDSFYQDNHVDLQLRTRVTSIDPATRTVTLAGGKTHAYGALLIATGADPIRLNVPGADAAHVHYLRSFDDSNTIIALAKEGAHAVVVGASFIGLEVAASLRARNVHVDVVAPDDQPLGRVLGPEIGRAVQKLHEKHGVTFHLGETVARIDGHTVVTSGGRRIDADLVVVGIGVKPVVDLAEKAGLAVDKGVLVNEFLETSVPGVFAAGDIARWPDRRTGERLRVEHWVVALRQGQTAAKNILGHRQAFDAAPFFWSQHYDTTVRYVGHAGHWDQVVVDGDPAKDCRASFRRAGREVAVATIGRDRECLEAEMMFEASDDHVQR